MAAEPITPRYGDDSTWGRPLDIGELAERVGSCRTGTPFEKGQALEQLMAWLVAHIPGVIVWDMDLRSSDHSQEIDLLIQNAKDPDGLPGFKPKLLIECKNWQKNVGSAEVAWFFWKLRLGSVKQGLLVVANDVTSSSHELSDARSIIANANVMKTRILVLRLTEIEQLVSVDDFKDLLTDKSMKLAGRVIDL